jgi:quercetin dioxygenase-like cupin family protein
MPLPRQQIGVIRHFMPERGRFGIGRHAGVPAPPASGRVASLRGTLELMRTSICLGGSDMVRTSFMGALVLFLVAVHIVPIGSVWAQVPGTAGHEHLAEVACVDVPAGKKRPEFGCFNVGTVTGLHFSDASVYWHLRAFPSRQAAEAAKSATGIVVEEDGRVWLSEFGDRNSGPRAGESIAVVGPLQLPAAKSYSAVLSYAVMRPGDSSRVHTHPGPEGWYVLAGEQCLETPAGANRARAGGTMSVLSNTPMELNVTGKTLRRAFALVIHDSAQDRGIPSDWKPSGACSQ